MSETDTSSAAAEGSASDEAGVEADTKPAVKTGPEASTIETAEGSASDEADGASGQSGAETSGDHQQGSASDEAGVEADAEPAVKTGPEASTDETAEGSADDDTTRSARKVRDGVVTSASMDKTIVVTITERVRHAKYGKFVLKSKKLYTHDESNDAGEGDKVRVMETRPMSKNKRWRLLEVTERAR
jgi:small subunit ribosomal protein S17